MSEPIWRDDEIPVRYNSIFVKEKADKFVQSKSKTILYSEVYDLMHPQFNCYRADVHVFHRQVSL